jgi:dienelactone hydrolase
MTTTMLSEPLQERAQPRTRAARRSREALVFGAATAVALVHALDDAFLHRQPGVGVGQHALAAVVSLVLGLGAVYVFPFLRPALRSGLALLFGSLATVNGMLHVKHIANSGAAASDLTGVLAAAAGAVLVGLAIAIPWLHRGEGAAGPRRRWAVRVLAVPLGLLAFVYTIVPMSIALTESHKYRETIGSPPSADYREVGFEATDGVDISAWYRPTQNGATIIVVHGGGGDRTGAVAHAKMLVRHGYGVLLHDARGRGKSEGVQNAYGWGWPKDVAGAIRFLKTREEVDPERIGALGLSTGADILIQVAGQGTDLKAVVADGTYAGSFEDSRRITGVGAITPFMALEFATVAVTSGTTAGPAIEDTMKRITSPLLLVAAGPDEKDAGELYDRAAGDRPVDVWYLPDVGHTAAIREAAGEYQRRVTAFFDGALTEPS